MLEPAAVVSCLTLGIVFLAFSVRLSRRYLKDADPFGCAMTIVGFTLALVSFGIAFAIYFVN